MRYQLIFISFFLIFISPDYEDSLIWSDHVKLTWDDFKGEKNIETDAVAFHGGWRHSAARFSVRPETAGFRAS